MGALAFVGYAIISLFILCGLLLFSSILSTEYDNEILYRNVDDIVYTDEPMMVTRVYLTEVDHTVIWDLSVMSNEGSNMLFTTPFNRVNLVVGNNNYLTRVIVNEGKNATTYFELEVSQDVFSELGSKFADITGEVITVVNWGVAGDMEYSKA